MVSLMYVISGVGASLIIINLIARKLRRGDETRQNRALKNHLHREMQKRGEA